MTDWTIVDFTEEYEVEGQGRHYEDMAGYGGDCPDGEVPTPEDPDGWCPGHILDEQRLFWVEGPSWVQAHDEAGSHFTRADAELFVLANKHREALLQLDRETTP